MKYGKVFVHAAEMVKREERYEFLEENQDGFLHGEIRVEAIKILRKQEKVDEIVIVGGPTPDGASKVKLIAEMIGGKTTQLETRPNTGGNIQSIKGYLGEDKGRNALLTNFYHIPRVLRLINDNGVRVIPLCAEAVLLTDDPKWKEKIEEWYGQFPMLKRILSEIQGLSDIEKENYQSKRR